MLLPVALVVLFLIGCWLYSLTDAVLTPAVTFRGLSKSTWIMLIAVTFIVGAVAWLVARYRRRHGAGRGAGSAYRWTAADEAVARHPAGRSREAGWDIPRGPDDDPEFLKKLDRLIHGEDRA